MNQPLVSIMMPVYNGMPLLQASVESILHQTYDNWECVICDDGSTDQTWEFLEGLESLEGRESKEGKESREGKEGRECEEGRGSKGDRGRFVLLRNEKNMGRGATRQHILEHCHGKYLCMLDSGDLMTPNRIEVQVQYLETHESDSLVSSNMICFGTTTTDLIVQELTTPSQTFTGYNYPYYAPSMLRMEFAKQSGFDSTLNEAEDHDFFDRYFRFNPQYHILQQQLYYYSDLEAYSRWSLCQSYYGYISMCFRKGRYYLSLLNLLKFLFSVLTLPFRSMESIQKNRGRKATAEETEQFQKLFNQYFSHKQS